MKLVLRSAALVSLLLAVAPRASAQDWLSFGVAAGVPGANGGGNHAMATVELGASRFPLRFRVDAAAVDYAPSGQRFAQLNANLLLPFIDRPLSPYAVVGIAFAPMSRLGSTGYGGEGLRAGVGLRYRVSERVLFVENAQHWGLNKSLLTIGVQF